MNFNETGYLCPRLVDYLVVVGNRSSTTTTGDFNIGPDSQTIRPGNRHPCYSTSKIEPELLRRYPAIDHPDFALPPDVIYFAQPEGCYRILQSSRPTPNPDRSSASSSRSQSVGGGGEDGRHSSSFSTSGGSGGGSTLNSGFGSGFGPTGGPDGSVSRRRDQSSFVFTLTDKDSGRTRFGICVNFYLERRLFPGPPEGGDDLSRGGGGITDSGESLPGHEPQVGSDGYGDWGGSTLGVLDEDYNGDKLLVPPRSLLHAGTDTLKMDALQMGLSEADLGTNYHRGSGNGQPSSLFGTDSYSEKCLTSLCLLSHHPFFSTFRDCLTCLRRIVESCQIYCDRYCRQNGAKNSGDDLEDMRSYGKSLWDILMGQPPVTLDPSFLEVAMIVETWILRLLSAPVPIPGRTKVELQILPKHFYPRSLLFALPDSTRFSLVDFPLHLPLELLGVDTCLQVLTCIMLEQKIIMQSRDHNALTMSVLALVSMIYPLEYMFPVIPLLPITLRGSEQLLLAPTPFIIGVPSSFFSAKRNVTLPRDVWLVDLDANKVIGPQGFDLPPFPEPEGTILRNHLKQALYSMSVLPLPNSPGLRETKSRNNSFKMDPTRHDEPYNSNYDIGPDPRNDMEKLSMGDRRNQESVLKYGNDVDSVDMATRIAMVKFFDSPNMFANFEEHCHILRLYPRPVVAFQINSFMRSRPRPTRFLFELAKTQAFEYFSEWSLSPSNAAYQRVKIGMTDPAIIGDKAKWFSDILIPIKFSALSEEESPVSSSEELDIDVKDRGTKVTKVLTKSRRKYSSPTLGHILTKVLSQYFHNESVVNLLKLSSPRVDDTREDKESGGTEIYNTSSSYSSNSNGSVPSTLNSSSIKLGRVPRPPVTTQRSHNEAYDRSLCKPDLSNTSTPFKLCDESVVYRAPTELRLPSQEELKDALRQSPDLDKPQETGKILVEGHVSSKKDRSFGKSRYKDRSKKGELGKTRHLSLNLGNKGGGISSSSDESSSIPTDYSTENEARSSHSDRDVSSTSLGTNVESCGKGDKEFIYYYNDQCSDVTRDKWQLDTDDKSRIPATASPPETLMSTNSSPSPYNHNRTSREFSSPNTNSSQSSTLGNNIKLPLPFLIGRNDAPAAAAIVGMVEFEGLGGEYEDVGDRLIRHFSTTINNFQLPRKLFDYYSKTFWFRTQEEVPLDEILPYGGNLQYEKPDAITRAYHVKRSMGVQGSKPNKTEKQYSSSVRERKKSLSTRRIGSGGTTRPRLLSTGEESRSSSSVLLGGGPGPVVDNRRISTSFWAKASQQEKRNRSSDNQSFLNEILDSVLRGQGVGWLKLSKFRTLLQDESCRLYMVSRLNRNALIGRGVRNDGLPVDAVRDQDNLTLEISHVPLTRQVWKGFASVLKCCLSGFEHTYSNYGIGGMASAYAMLEIADTHYYHVRIPLNDDVIDDVIDSIKSTFDPRRRRSSSHGVISHPSEALSPGKQGHFDVFSENNIKGNLKTTCSTFMDPGKTYEKLSSIGSKLSTTLSNAATNALDMADEGFKKAQQNIPNNISHISSDKSLQGPDSEDVRTNKEKEYLYEIFLGKDRSKLWDQSQFWEDIFMDAVTQERDMIGLDLGPSEMMIRYASLPDVDKKRMELEEDNLLAIQLLNLVAFMVLMKVNKRDICHKVRRLLAKSHVGLKYSQAVNKLLDKINNLEGNDIPLLVPASRQIRKMSFTVRSGIDPAAESMIMEVCEDAIVFRTSKGEIIDRLWYDKLINMTLSPRSKVLCLWWKCGAKTYLQKFYTRKCRDLYEAIKQIMERVASKKGTSEIMDTEMGGHFQIGSLYSDQLGDLDVSVNGISIAFPDAQTTLHLNQVKKCKAEKDNQMFTLEIFDYYSQQLVDLVYTAKEATGIVTSASVICYIITTCFHYHLWRVLSRASSRPESQNLRHKENYSIDTSHTPSGNDMHSERIDSIPKSRDARQVGRRMKVKKKSDLRSNHPL